MKKFTSLLAVALSFFGLTATAQDVPTAGASIDEATAYTLTNARASKYAAYAGEGTRTALTTTFSEAVLWKFVDASAAVTEALADGVQPVYVYNVGAGKYLSNVDNGSYTAEPATVLYLKSHSYGDYNGIAVGANASFDYYGGWNDYQGSGTAVSYWTADDAGSIWTFAAETADLWTEAYSTAKTAAQTVVDAVTDDATTSDGTLFYYNAEKVAAAKALLAAETPTELAEIKTALATLNGTTKAGLMNMPTNGGTYVLSNDGRDSKTLYLGVSYDKQLLAYTAASTRSLWKVAEVDGGYTFQNVHTGLYLNNSTETYTHWTAGTTPSVLQIYPYDHAIGTAAVGIEGNLNKMHNDGGKDANGNHYIVRWSSGGCNDWTFTAYNETDLAEAYATAEATQLTTDKAAVSSSLPTAVATAQSIATLLGIDDFTAPSTDVESVTTLSELITLYASASANTSAAVYAKASGNYYRIMSVARTTDDGGAVALGINNGGMPAGEAKTLTDADQLWQFVPSGSGFKLYNPNADAYMSNVVSGNNSAAATFVSADAATVYYICIDDATAGTFDISKSTSSAYNNTINMEGSSYTITNYGGVSGTSGTASFPLNQWKGTNSKMTIEKAEVLDVDLATASVGGAYATAYLPFAVTLPTEGVKGYVGGDIADGYIKMTEATAVAAKQGFVLEGTEAKTVSLTIGAEAGATSTVGGTLTDITLTDENRAQSLVFGIGSKNGQLGFYKPSSAITTIAHNKAFVAATGATGAIALQFGAITGIDAAATTADAADNAAIYDLSGRRVLKAAKGGLYIKNGKKVVLK